MSKRILVFGTKIKVRENSGYINIIDAYSKSILELKQRCIDEVREKCANKRGRPKLTLAKKLEKSEREFFIRMADELCD